MKVTTYSDRTVQLDDISIRAVGDGGDGRIIDAYAAVFNVRQFVSDWEGEYDEIILPGAFEQTIRADAGRVQALVNHGQTIHGMSSERFSMPYGTIVEMRTDKRGLMTATRAAATPLGDEILALVDAGALRSFSFGGRWMASRRTEPKKPGQTMLIERQEIMLRDFGPAVFPVYDKAVITGTRAEDLSAALDALPAEERAQLLDRYTTHVGTAGDATGAAGQAAHDTHVGTAGDATGAAGQSIDALELANANRRRR